LRDENERKTSMKETKNNMWKQIRKDITWKELIITEGIEEV
jgi:hypothetical protein